MNTPTLNELESSAEQVYQALSPTPQMNWPLLDARCGCEVWVKHENHNPTGSFKVRGGLVYLARLKQREPGVQGIVAATRGNHGQSVAFAAARHGVRSVIVVPEGNNTDKNRAMLALGAELIVHGADFDESVSHAQQLAQERQLHGMPSFHMDLVTGVASYGLELLRSQTNLSRIYVPIGLGSGICGTICARNALGSNTEIIGVVAENANTYQRSFAAAECIPTDSANTLADGLAVRVPSAEALEMILANVARIVSVSDEEILSCVSYYFSDTHNIAEGAGAATLAALLQERQLNAGQRVAVVLSGGNMDAILFRRALED